MDTSIPSPASSPGRAFPSVEESRQRILGAIGQAPDLTFIRGLGNIGDEFILAGTRELLSGHIYREIPLNELPGASGELAVLTGGGAWSRAYNEYMPEALAIAEQRFERVIVLPSTFEIAEPRVRAALERSDALFFARELESLGQISELCCSELAHDCAFFTDLSAFDSTGSGELNAFRTDHESGGQFEAAAGSEDISATANSLEDWLGTIERHAVVNTDRAHVMIAAARLGKKVRYREGSYFKLGAIAQSSLAEYDVAPMEGQTIGRSDDRDARVKELAGGKYLLLLAPGMKVEQASIDALVAALDADDAAIAATGTIGGEFCGGWIGDSGSVLEIAKQLSEETAQVGWVPVFGTLFRASAFDAAPLPIEWAESLKSIEVAGQKMLACPDAGISTEDCAPPIASAEFVDNVKRAHAITAHADFFARNGRLIPGELGWLLPELREDDGQIDEAAARLLLGLVQINGPEWLIAERMNGGLEPLLGAWPDDGPELVELPLERLDWLELRNERLVGIEGGGWWKLRERLAPLLAIGRRGSENRTQ